MIFKPKGLFCLMAFSLLSCSCRTQHRSGISGKIILTEEWKPMAYLVQPRYFNEIAANYLGQVIDSAKIAADGTFAFEHLPETQEKLLLQLVVQKINSRFANHLMDSIPSAANYMPFILANGNPVKIKADISSFQKSFKFIDPSSENKDMISLRDIRIEAFQKYMAAEGEGMHDDSLLLEREDLYQSYINAIMRFTESTTSIEVAMVSIRWISPTSDFERIPEFIYSQCEKWRRDQPEHPFTKQLCRIVDKNLLPVMIGDLMPDYPLPMVNGDTIRLGKLLGQNLTIIDLWASWCAPCRIENVKVLSPLWSVYKDKGLQIIGYSIDNDESSWKSAVQKDGATWPQASHLTGDVTPFMEALRITTIPANFILDADGKVIAKNLNGDDLKDFIKRYLE